MSQHINHRRDGKRHQDNGPTWEGNPPNSGCNSTHVARARSAWRKRGRRAERRTGLRGSGSAWWGKHARQQGPTVAEGLREHEDGDE